MRNSTSLHLFGARVLKPESFGNPIGDAGRVPNEDGRRGWSVLYLFSRDATPKLIHVESRLPTAHHFYPEPNKKRERPG